MTGVTVGSTAPELALRDQHGRIVRLAPLLERAPLLLAFYPYAFSNVCAGELQALRDWHAPRTGAVQVVAVSCDPMFALRAFAEANRLAFPLLSDFWPHGEVATSYGVFDAGLGCARRSAFLVDRAGSVAWSVHSPMGEARDLEDYSRALDRLR